MKTIPLKEAKKRRAVDKLATTLEKFKGRRIASLSSAECRELIRAYGDLTNELDAGHAESDAGVWQAVLRDNIGGGEDTI